MRFQMTTASVVRRQAMSEWTTLHLFKPAPLHLSTGVNLFKSTEPPLTVIAFYQLFSMCCVDSYFLLKNLLDMLYSIGELFRFNKPAAAFIKTKTMNVPVKFPIIMTNKLLMN